MSHIEPEIFAIHWNTRKRSRLRLLLASPAGRGSQPLWARYISMGEAFYVLRAQRLLRRDRQELRRRLARLGPGKCFTS